MTESIPDLFKLTLADGLVVERDGRQIRYKTVRMREVNVADERAAVRLAERVVTVGGVPQLLVSSSDQQYALTMMHIDRFECDSLVIERDIINLDLLGKLSSHDLGLIEQRVFLVNLAAKVRYGLIDAAEFQRFMSGESKTAESPPQPVGQAADVGAQATESQSGPAMLSDFVNTGSNVATALVGG